MKLRPSFVLLTTLLISTQALAAETINGTSCVFSEIEIGRMKEFAMIRDHLRREVFSSWSSAWPNMFFFDDSCQFILNYSGTELPSGFALSPQTFRLDGFDTDRIYVRKNEVALPAGTEMEFSIPAQAWTFGGKGTEKWFVMGLYGVWKRDYKDPLEFYFGMLAHEMFQPFQFGIPELKSRMEAMSKATYTDFYKHNPDFAKIADQELALLDQAVKADSGTQKKALLKKFFSLRAERRGRFFSGALQKMAASEPLLETVEGTAEYMNFRVMLDAREFPLNPKLSALDPDFDDFRRYRGFKLDDALKNVRSRPSYVQNIGVYTAIILNQVYPGWQDAIFKRSGGGEDLLREYLAGRP